ncbi:hypothetical protein [Gemmatimonas sp.]|jgi:N-acetyl-beta-hexosaminidase|uniref:hypothetical protein n=2 Tax=Gemmatimonas sp. TaxID=1962908 RepID=UPI0037C0A8D1
MRRRLGSLSLALLLSACVRTNATMLGTATAVRPQLSAESVRIYRTADQVKSKYEEIAILNSAGESNWTNEGRMAKSMRSKAAKLGANAIILDGISEPSAGAKIAGAFLGTGVERKGKAIAIFVFADSAKAP